MPYIPPLLTPLFRPSGRVVAIQAYPAVTNDHEAIRFYQRILMGLGFTVGPRLADGLWGSATSAAVERFQRWYNSEPAASRGRTLVVDGLLGPATQTALHQYQTRAADRPVPQVPTLITAGPPSAPSSASAVPVTGVPTSTAWSGPADPWAGDVANRASFLDGLRVAPSVAIGAPASSGTSPWVVVGALAALTTGLVAIARYWDDKKVARR